MYRLLSLICVASVLCSPLHAEIYRHTDEQGRTVYSDSPRDGGSPVDLPPVNTTPAVSPPPPAKLDRHATPVPASVKVQIIQPRDGQPLAFVKDTCADHLHMRGGGRGAGQQAHHL